MNAQYQQLVQAELYAKLASNVPNFTIGRPPPVSEVECKNIHNNGRGLSLAPYSNSIPTVASGAPYADEPDVGSPISGCENQPKF